MAGKGQEERWPAERGSHPDAPRLLSFPVFSLCVPTLAAAAPEMGVCDSPAPRRSLACPPLHTCLAFLQITYHFLSFLTTLSVFFFLELFFSKPFKTPSGKRDAGELLLDAGFFQC